MTPIHDVVHRIMWDTEYLRSAQMLGFTLADIEAGMPLLSVVIPA